MKRYVADTHALYWYLTASPRLTDAARAAFDEGARGWDGHDPPIPRAGRVLLFARCSYRDSRRCTSANLSNLGVHRRDQGSLLFDLSLFAFLCLQVAGIVATLVLARVGVCDRCSQAQRCFYCSE
jgi:hypothetical protein